MSKTRLTLTPGANGTKRLVARYGERLVCVRYRYDAERRRRIKTVELIEEETAWVPSDGLFLVRIEWGESALRERVKESGGRWNAQRRLWLVSGRTVRRLMLEERVVDWIDVSERSPR